MDFLNVIGCGPGSLNFLLILSIKTIFFSKIIFYESLINLNLLNYSFLNSKKILIGKRFNQKSIFKKTVFLNLLILYFKYKNISLLKSGDILIFGRINNEISFFNINNLKYKLISGVTSVLYCLNKLNYFLTFRFNISSILFITYLNSNLNIKYKPFFLNKTIIYYMINNNYSYILDELFSLDYFFYILLIESSNFFFEHIFIFNLNDLNNYFFKSFFYFDFPKIILINYFLIYLSLKKFFINLF